MGVGCARSRATTLVLSSLIRFDCFAVDLAAGRLFNRGARVRIREQSFQGTRGAAGASGRGCHALRALRLRAMSAKVCVPPTSFALIHLGLGERDACFEWLDRAIDERDHLITPIKTYPFLDPVRDDPRYAALLKKVRLA